MTSRDIQEATHSPPPQTADPEEHYVRQQRIGKGSFG